MNKCISSISSLFAEDRKLRKIAETEHYINSGYRFEKVNNKYALVRLSDGLYVDLRLCFDLKTDIGRDIISYYINNCLGNVDQVIKAFYIINPIIRPFNIKCRY